MIGAARLLAFLARLGRNRRGATAILVAGSLFALGGAAVMAVDLGSIYLAKRRLQGIADAAAMAAVADLDSGGRASAEALIVRSGAQAVTIDRLVPGRYRRDKAVAMSARFVPAPTDPSAVQLVLGQRIPLFFGVLLTRDKTMTIKAEATASRTDLAAFSLGTRLASLSGGVPNQILSALAGTELGLTAADSQGLAAADVDILHFADALRIRANQPDATYAELFGMQLPLHTVIGAMADVGGGASGALAAIEAQLSGAGTVRLSDLIDLGPVGQSDVADGGMRIKVDALSLLRSVLELSHGDHYQINLAMSALGLVGTNLKLVGGQGEVHSPWMTVTDAHDVVIRSAQTRLYLDSQLGTGPLNLVGIRLPIYVELASAEARLTDITCGEPANQAVSLAVTPAVGTLAIADINPAAMNDLTTPVVLQPAKLATTPIAQVNGFAKIALGGTAAQTVRFTRDDIDDGITRSVGTNDLVQGAATSLLSHTQLSASLLGASLPGLGALLSALVSAVGGKLAVAAPAVDTLLNQLTQTLGLRLGVADVRVNQMRCGLPILVA